MTALRVTRWGSVLLVSLLVVVLWRPVASSPLRTIALGTAPWQLAVNQRAHRAFIYTATQRGNTVSVLDTASGALLHTVQVGGTLLFDSNELQFGVARLLAVDEQTQRVFVEGQRSDGQGQVSVLDARSGALLRTIVLGPHLNQTGAIGVDERTQRVFVLGQGLDGRGKVSVLEARSGRLLRTLSVGAHPVAVAVNRQTSRVLVSALGPTNSAGEVTSDGNVSVLDEHTLAVRRTLTVGAAPADLAVDEPSGHTLVINSNYNPSDCSLAFVQVPEAGWVQGLRWLQQRLGWLPLRAPQPPAPITHGSVMLLTSAHE